MGSDDSDGGNANCMNWYNRVIQAYRICEKRIGYAFLCCHLCRFRF